MALSIKSSAPDIVAHRAVNRILPMDKQGYNIGMGLQELKNDPKG